jgi:hypothetical protein
MTSFSTAGSPILDKIKQTLDPDCRYVVFEKRGKLAADCKFFEVLEAVSRLKMECSEYHMYHDTQNHVALLVLRVDFGRTDEILEDFLNLGIPKDITFYAFGARI